MTVTVKVGYAKTHLSELLGRVESGEEVVISRGDTPIARLIGFGASQDVAAVIREIKAARKGLVPTTTAEILAWRDEGRR